MSLRHICGAYLHTHAVDYNSKSQFRFFFLVLLIWKHMHTILVHWWNIHPWARSDQLLLSRTSVYTREKSWNYQDFLPGTSIEGLQYVPPLISLLPLVEETPLFLVGFEFTGHWPQVTAMSRNCWRPSRTSIMVGILGRSLGLRLTHFRERRAISFEPFTEYWPESLGSIM